MISREEAITELNTNNCVDCACGSSLLPTPQCKWKCKYKDSIIRAISDMQKLDRIEHTKPIDLIKEFGSLSTEQFNKISHWYSQSKKLEQIIKKDVCEWKMPNDNADEWTPSCEKNSVFNVFGVAWFKYCPYCGRKVKVEE